MRDLLTVVVLGTVSGLQAGLLAVGLVLIFQARRFMNFAQGQMGLVSAAVLGVLVLNVHVPYALALVAAILVGPAVGFGVNRLLSWRLETASATTLSIASIGVSQLLLIAVLTGPLALNQTKLATRGYPVPFKLHWTLGSYTLTASELITLTVAPLLVLGLQLFITRTRVGTSIRGMASNRDAALLAGISIRRTSTIVWTLAGLVSAVAAILVAPSQPASSFSAAATALLLRGVAAAVIARMADFRVALAAGIALGIVEQGFVFWTSAPGLSNLAIFVILAVGLAVRARRLRTDTTADVPAPPAPPVAPVGPARIVPAVGWLCLVAGLLILPIVPGLQTQERALLLTLIIVYAVTGLSLTVLTGWAGQVSLGQFALVGVGAFAAERLFNHNLGIPVVVLEVGMITAVVAVLVGLPAVRLGRLFTAVSTLGFAFAARSWLFRQHWVTGNNTGYMHVAELHIFGTEVRTVRAVYMIAVVVLVLTLLLLRTVRASSIGRGIIAVRDNQDLAGAHGLEPLVSKLVALALSGFIAGTAGVLWAMATRQWTFDSFDPTMSVVLLAAAIVGSITTLFGPILGVFAVFAWPYLVPGADTLVVRSFTSGALLLAVLLFAPGGIGLSISKVWARRTPLDDQPQPLPTPVKLRRPQPVPPRAAGSLAATGISKRFGGIVAVDDVSMHVAEAEIVGIIGGNGAGKSTLLDCLAGRQQLDTGTVVLDGQEMSMFTSARRAALGVARTFQDAILYPGLTVEEAVLVAFDRTNTTGTISAALGTPWAQLAEAEKRRVVAEMLDQFGLWPYAKRLTSDLSTGMRRICDLTAVVVSRPAIALLDEPTAGLAQREVEAFGRLLQSVRDAYGASVLIVEHDIPLLMQLCDRLYCMEQGRVIAEGSPVDVTTDPRVIASCLGTDEVAIGRSGNGRRPPRRASNQRSSV